MAAARTGRISARTMTDRRRSRRLPVAVAGAITAILGIAVLLVAWLAMLAGGLPSASCGTATDSGHIRDASVPPDLVPIFTDAADRYGLGSGGATILAALTKVESDFGHRLGPSAAGAVGWTQFLPETWRRFGVDANGDGYATPYEAEDAIHAAARYLHASGAPTDWRRALFTYNHADWYVARVLRQAQQFGLRSLNTPAACAAQTLGAATLTTRTYAGRIVDLPDMPGQRIDARIVDDIVLIVATFRVRVTAGYALTGHDPRGEHPLGLAVDVVPGSQGTWDDVDR